VIGLIAVTAAGRKAAARLASAWRGTRVYPGPTRRALTQAFAECDQIVCFLAVGATVRLIAPLLTAKTSDPGVVCVDEACTFAVPVAGAHAGGANRLARAAADVLGATAVITTASDAAGIPALDEFGVDLGFRAEPDGDLAEVGRAILSGERVTLSMDQTWPVPPLPPNVVRTESPEPGIPAIVVTDRLAHVSSPSVIYRPPSLVLGAGASRGVTAAEVGSLMDEALDAAGVCAASVCRVATIDLKQGEQGLLQAAGERGWQVTGYPAADLAAMDVPNPSEAVLAATGTPSVAEAAALFCAGVRGVLAAGKRKSGKATVAIARRQPRGRLTLVGLGPGARDLMSPRAVAELRRATVVVGLGQYVDRIRDLLRPGTRVTASELGAEEERAAEAVAQARAGHAVALVGSGDAGIYAMASPALELADGTVEVTGVPGVTAAVAAAAVLGAPLGHDHAYISLSDLHTPWDAIERRIGAAADADFVVCFYNPRSRARVGHLAKALAILAPRRPPQTPVGMVADAYRPGQRAVLSTLAEFDPAQADMRTMVIVGSSQTRVVAGRMVTPRGYRWREA
jgi:cobalt-precorrin 5A hydrolase / cobalt-factor III methyltransferase / precorrin-3B C17-methyltransferase